MRTIKTKQSDVGVIVARFQVAELHEAHTGLIDVVKNNHKKVFIFLGLSPVKGSVDNPLDFESRKQMVLAKYPEINVLYIKDMKSDKAWSNTLDNQINDLTGPNQTITLYGGRSSFINHYLGKFTCKELESESIVSGTKIRKEISVNALADANFRKGVIWHSMNVYVNALPTVDIAIFNADKTKLLLGKKHYESKFRFIGGHVESGETYEQAAIRETYEETNLQISDLRYVKSIVVDDWRHRSEKQKITTILFYTHLTAGMKEAKDDIEELRWFNVADLIKAPEDKVEEEHLPLVKLLFS